MSTDHETRWIGIELLSDLVLSRTGRTEGGHSSLDHIPGSALFGALIGQLLQEGHKATDIIGSSLLTCGNGYPAIGKDPAYPVPFSYHCEKSAGSGAGPLALINGLRFDSNGKDPSTCQQLRSGYIFSGQQVKPEKNYRLKTARDIDRFGAAKESSLFGYEALAAGQRFIAPIRGPAELLQCCLPNKGESMNIRLGRSRSAEYASVSVRLIAAPKTPASKPLPEDDSRVALYCASDFAPVDTNGTPTLDPQSALVGILGSDARYLPECSYLRTRFYWPWNQFYGGPDRGHQVICAGSVLVFKDAVCDQSVFHTGLFQNEGLGHILVNSDFVSSPPPALEKLSGSQNAETDAASNAAPPTTPLFQLLVKRRDEEAVEDKAIQKAETLTKGLLALKNKNEAYPSRTQWGVIRATCARPGTSSQAVREELVKHFNGSLRRTQWSQPLQEKILEELPAKESTPKSSALALRTLYHASIFVARELR